jgi:pSer/pThr/pTyr-binding forkhead associated (FHA) protein
VSSGKPDEPLGGHRPKILQVIAGPAAGTSLELIDELSLGRAEDHGGDLGGDPALSRHHAVLRGVANGTVTVEDLGSANGTFVNGDRITAIRPVHPGDTLAVGDSSLRLTVPAGEATAPPGGRAPTDVPLAVKATYDDDTEGTGWVPVVPSMRAPAPPYAPPEGARQQSGEARQRRGSWTGTAASVNRRVDQVGRRQGAHQEQVITFRLEQFTEHGDRGRVLSVELRGEALRGDVANGDRVEASGRLRGGVLKARAVHNLTTGATVSQVGVLRRRLLGGGRAVFMVVFIVLWLCVAAFIVYELTSHHAL